MKNGTWIFVSDDPAAAGFPEKGARYILTDTSGGTTHGDISHPGPDVFRVLSTAEARAELGHIAVRQPGITMFFNDVDGPGVKSFLGHYYHFIGEMFLGLWRLTVSSGDFELPTRLMYRALPNMWRDKARITPWFQRAVLAGVQIEEDPHWQDRRESGLAYLYDRLAFADRWAAHNHGREVNQFNKVGADLPKLDVPVNWLEPMRDRVVHLSEAAGCQVKRKHANVPVVTYVDRQKTKRRLLAEDHKNLVASLAALDAEGTIEFVHAQMETMDRIHQFCLAARTDIMVGVHGNGLSHQLWMRPGSGVLEIMNEGGFARDYGILAEMSSHEYYAIHNDKTFPAEKWRKADGWVAPQNEGFHGDKIRVDGAYIATLVKNMAGRRKYGPTPVKW